MSDISASMADSALMDKPARSESFSASRRLEMRRAIMKAAHDELGITRDQMRTSSRSRQILWPRQLAMYLLRKDAKLTTESIGRIFFRYHTSVIHAVRKIEGKVNGPLSEEQSLDIERVRRRYQPEC